MKNYIEHQEDNNVNEDVSFDMWLGQYASPKYDQKYIKPRSVKKCDTMSSENVKKTIT
jgi:hypothetical protein